MQEERHGSQGQELQQEGENSTLSGMSDIADGLHRSTLPKKHPDIDGGWAYVVLAAMFCGFFINTGLLSTVGMYYVQLLDTFGKDRSFTSWLGSLLNSFILLAGPLSGFCLHSCGTQNTIRTGSIIMCSGLYISSFTPTPEIMFFTFGVCVACGMNMVYTGQISSLNQYFDQYQYVATAFAMVGSGMGIFLVNMLTEYIMNEYGWRGSLILNAGLALQLCIIGSIIFPLKTYNFRQRDTSLYSIINMSTMQQDVPTDEQTGLSTLSTLHSSAVVRSVSTRGMSVEASFASNFILPITSLNSVWQSLKGVRFWLLSSAYFFAVMSTTSIFIIYKDFMKSRGLADKYTNILVGVGISDAAGRLSMGIIHTSDLFNPVWSYSVALFTTGLVLIGHILVRDQATMFIFGMFFGFVNGSQNVLIAITPIRLFGKDSAVFVFCCLLFFGGIGALIGAPIAGVIVDKSGTYDPVLGFVMSALIVASLLVAAVAIIDTRKKKSMDTATQAHQNETLHTDTHIHHITAQS